MILLCGLLISAFVAVPSALSIDSTESDLETYEEPGMNTVGNSSSDSLERLNVSLSFGNMELKDLADGFVKGEFLTHLSLEGNQIETISSLAFEFVPRLSYLSLANNLLQNIDLQQFSTITSLETLNLNGNCKKREQSMVAEPPPPRPIHRNSRSFGSWAQWGQSEESQEYFDESTTEPPEVIWTPRTPPTPPTPCEVNLSAQLPSLTKLYLENNNLKWLKYSDGMNLPSLTHLYLSGNELDIDNAMMSNLSEHMPSLSDLHLKDSRIFKFDASQLPTVTSLYLDRNNIRSICNEYCEYPSFLKLKDARNLETLSVSLSGISKIEADAFNYTTSLVTLDLSSNKISEIREGTFDKLHSLRSLSLEGNELVTLNAVHTFRSLINLENLSLGTNQISNITRGAFENLVTLKTLTLSHNKISYIDSGIFSKLTNLEELSLASNRLSQIPDGSMPASDSLITLNLDGNRFTNMTHIPFTNLSNLLFLSLKENPLRVMNLHWHSIVSENLTIILGNTYPNYG